MSEKYVLQFIVYDKNIIDILKEEPTLKDIIKRLNDDMMNIEVGGLSASELVWNLGFYSTRLLDVCLNRNCDGRSNAILRFMVRMNEILLDCSDWLEDYTGKKFKEWFNDTMTDIVNSPRQINTRIAIADIDDEILTMTIGYDFCDEAMIDYRARSNELLAQDMMCFEGHINMIGVETRTEDTNNFRNFYDIMIDIARVIANNPTIIDDMRDKIVARGDMHYDLIKDYDYTGVKEVISRLKDKN